jgi:hypothetical protein
MDLIFVLRRPVIAMGKRDVKDVRYFCTGEDKDVLAVI